MSRVHRYLVGSFLLLDVLSKDSHSHCSHLLEAELDSILVKCYYRTGLSLQAVVSINSYP